VAVNHRRFVLAAKNETRGTQPGTDELPEGV
jgi:hypothetical protein